MTVYLTNIGLIFIYAVCLLYKQPNERKKRNFVILATGQWILLSGLRNINIGADTIQYSDSFYRTADTAWSVIWRHFVLGYKGGMQGKDFGYSIFEKVCSYITKSYQGYLILVALLFHVSMGYSIYKNSRDPFISFLLYSCLFYAFFAITGIRQTVATALVVCIGYELIKKKKLLYFIIMIALAATIHKSALIFIIFYPICHIRVTTDYKRITLVAIVVSFLFRSQLSALYKKLAGLEEYGVYQNAGANTFVLLLLLIFITCYIFSTNLLREDRHHHFYNAIVLAVFFVPLTYINPSAMRVVQYFSFFLMFMIPEIIYMLRGKQRASALVMFVLVLTALFIKTSPQPYLFFWQG